jgi:hypothetical protein
MAIARTRVLNSGGVWGAMKLRPNDGKRRPASKTRPPQARGSSASHSKTLDRMPVSVDGDDIAFD